MIQDLLFWLIRGRGAFFLLFLLDGKIHAYERKDAIWRLGFIVDEA